MAPRAALEHAAISGDGPPPPPPSHPGSPSAAHDAGVVARRPFGDLTGDPEVGTKPHEFY